MDALTPAERRGALVVVLLLAIGAMHDLWRAARPPAADSAGPAARPGVGAPAREWAEGSEPFDPNASPVVGSGAGSRGGILKLDLNRASARDLEALPGIGPVLAARIIAHRDLHGPFRSDEELLAVRGIGPRLFARLRPHVTARLRGMPADPARADTSASAL